MKPAREARKPYIGQKSAIVIAMDVGTLFSGVSYALLDPGKIPEIHEVTKFPGLMSQAVNCKIPSVIWYDLHGNAVKVGAEAEELSNINTAEEQGWTKVELFKPRLRPKPMNFGILGMKLPSLPESKSAVDVFGDFLKYLFSCTRSFIEAHAGGASTWKSVENDIQFILSHPNGWEGAQQSDMRKAAIYGGLIPNTDEGKATVRFVTEGEARLHACISDGLADSVLSHGFVVVDAGGATLDISSYVIKAVSPLLVEEIARPDSLFSGSAFVSLRARSYLENKLKNSKYCTPGILDHIVKLVDEILVRSFWDRGQNQYLPFGSPPDKDTNVGIRNGKLRLTGDEVADLFEPSIEAVVSSVRNQIILSRGVVKSVWLVGGFAASHWFLNQLRERLEPDGIIVSRPDDQTSKTVANGALSFYFDHYVGSRISRYAYGVEFLREFDPADPEHRERQTRVTQMASGKSGMLPDAFDCILPRDLRVEESISFSRKYYAELKNLPTLSTFDLEIWCYRGSGDPPKWILRGQDSFSRACVVRADLSGLTRPSAHTSQDGTVYWTIVFSIELYLGSTEFNARIKWNDDGKVKYGPAKVMYE